MTTYYTLVNTSRKNLKLSFSKGLVTFTALMSFFKMDWAQNGCLDGEGYRPLD